MHDSSPVEGELLRRAESVIAEPLGEKRVLLHPETGEYFSLDAVGGEVWDLCDGRHDLAQIAAEIAGRYDVEHGRALADVEELVAELRGAGLLVRA